MTVGSVKSAISRSFFYDISETVSVIPFIIVATNEVADELSGRAALPAFFEQFLCGS